MSNPLLSPSPLPFHAPPFDKISDSDFAPAFDEGLRQHAAEIDAIANHPAAPTFENTLVALERSGQTLTRVHLVFRAKSGADTNAVLQALQEDIAPKLAAHHDAIYLNAALFARIEALYATRDQLALDPESRRLLDVEHQQFVMAGANLSDAEKTRLRRMNEEEASLGARFMNQLLAAVKDAALVVDDRAGLAGLPEADIAAAAEAAGARQLEGRWLVALTNTTQPPVLESLTKRSTRERIFLASTRRAERGDANDTRTAIARIAAVRAEKAALLGQPSFAAWRLQDQMAKTPEAAQAFLDRLVPAATAKARQEAADIQALIDRQRGGLTLEPWDWTFYAAQVRKARFDFDVAETKPYFELDRVLVDGVFFAAHELYGLTFAERHDLPAYHQDVRVFDVFDEDGSALALFYADFFARDNKNGGAWMDQLAIQSTLLETAPIICNVTNFTKPAPGRPALISFYEVTTLFHEFGHGLHGLLSRQTYPTLSGTAVSRDFVELPSQINEHWAIEPAVFRRYARHYETGAAMPDDLVAKIRNAETFNQGYALTEILAAVALDLAWHSLPPDATVADVAAFEAAALASAGLDLPYVPPRYRSSYFLHIWANGYESGYYAYLWAEMLDTDAFAWFEEHGGLTRENGRRFREMILSKGNSGDFAEMYRAFRGRDARIDAMLKKRGLLEGSAPRA